jgi:glycosyltransferase involved in cell wall biosynthesis
VKILLVHNTYQQPGGEDVIFEQECEMLRKAGHQVITYCRSNWEVDQYPGVRRVLLAKSAVWASQSRSDFARLLHEEKPDLVHVHNTFVMISPSIYSACAEAKVPVVQTLHNYRLLCPAATFFRDGRVCEECLTSLWPGVEHACYHDSHAATAVVAMMLAAHRLRHTWEREIACFVALSQFARNKFIEGGLPREKIFVKPNFVDPDPAARTGIGDCAVFVGRLSPKKRLSTLLTAWTRLSLNIPLLIIGGGADLAQLQAEAAQAGLTNVSFKGQLSRAETMATLNKARFLVFSSEWYENFPVTLVEAFGCSTPVICSRMGVMEEIVADGRTGIHFTPADADDLSRKVEWAWTHPEEMTAMAKAARLEYESKYTAERQCSPASQRQVHRGKKLSHADGDLLSSLAASLK